MIAENIPFEALETTAWKVDSMSLKEFQGFDHKYGAPALYLVTHPCLKRVAIKADVGGTTRLFSIPHIRLASTPIVSFLMKR